MVTVRIRSTAAAPLVGQNWRVLVEAGELPTLVVTKPDGTTLTPAVTFEQAASTRDWAWTLPFGTYGYTALIPVDAAGRWLAAVSTATDGFAGVAAANVSAVTLSADMPDADSLDDWLGGADAHSFPTEKLEEKIAIALDRQRGKCNIPAAYPPDLREAAHRRAARLLFLERQLTEQPRTDGDFDTPPTFPPGRDFATRELEHGYLKTPVG